GITSLAWIEENLITHIMRFEFLNWHKSRVAKPFNAYLNMMHHDNYHKEKPVDPAVKF
ncbi:hypothetical protein ACJX0J_031756, partial [Zea mays]